MSGEILDINVIEETIVAELVEETYDVNVVEEIIEIQIAPETLIIDIQPETIDVNINDESIDVSVEAFCNPCGGGGGGNLFVTNVTGSGIVSDKIYVLDTVPSNKVITEASTDNDNCIIHFIAEGGAGYSPKVSLGTDPCTNLQEDSNDHRFFTGSFSVTVTETTTFTLFDDSGSMASVIINRASLGPAILTCVIGSYPGVQTAVKSGDSVVVTGTVEGEATHVRLIDFGAFNSTGWIPCSGGAYSIPGTISGRSGVLNAKVQAKNSFGTTGTDFISSNTIVLDQVIPQFDFHSVTFPSGQAAFKGVETGSVDITVTEFSSLLYTSPHADFSIPDDTVYSQVKTIVCTNPGDYNDSSDNFHISAWKASNGSFATYDRVIEVADTAPVVTVTQPNTRLQSSALGETYTITATSNQNLATVPGINIPVSGTWLGSAFVGGTKVYNRDIQIIHGDDSGIGAWEFITAPVNNAGLIATITGNENVGGFVSHDIALAPFATVANLLTNVSDTSKLSLTWSFKPGMTFNSIGTTPPVVNGWTINVINTTPTNVIILDTSAANASSQESVLTIEESI